MVDFKTVSTGGDFWKDFYGSVIGNGIGPPALQQINFLNMGADPVGKGAAFSDLSGFLQGGGAGAKASGTYADPIDQIISDIFGWQKDDKGTADDVKGLGAVVKETTDAGGGDFFAGLVEGLGGMVARVAIIVLGFVFVAVGLSMFKDGALAVVTGKV